MCGKHSSQNFSNSPIPNNFTISVIHCWSDHMYLICSICLLQPLSAFLHHFLCSEDFVYMDYSGGLLPSNFQSGWSIGTPGRSQRWSKKVGSLYLFFSAPPCGVISGKLCSSTEGHCSTKVAHCMTLSYWVLVAIPPFPVPLRCQAPGTALYPMASVHSAHTLQTAHLLSSSQVILMWGCHLFLAEGWLTHHVSQFSVQKI